MMPETPLRSRDCWPTRQIAQWLSNFRTGESGHILVCVVLRDAHPNIHRSYHELFMFMSQLLTSNTERTNYVLDGMPLPSGLSRKGVLVSSSVWMYPKSDVYKRLEQ